MYLYINLYFMSEKITVRHKKSGKIATLTHVAYQLVKDSYDIVTGGQSPNPITTTKKKGEDVDAESELEKARNIWRGLFNQDPNPRKKLETLQREIDEFNSGETK